jgi:hypothetical protein
MRKYLACIAVVALAMSTIAACGGDDDDSANNSSGTTVQSGDNGSTGSTGSTTGNADYDALLKKAKTSKYRVTYESGANDEITISNDPPKSAFISGDSMFIDTGSEELSCSGTGSDAKCIKSPLGQAGIETMLTGFFGVYSALITAADKDLGIVFDVSKSGDEEIAGRSAQCAEITGGALVQGKGHLKACVDKETGVLLLGESSDGSDTNKIEATKFEDPKDSDFEPPAEPTDLSLPDLPTTTP